MRTVRSSGRHWVWGGGVFLGGRLPRGRVCQPRGGVCLGGVCTGVSAQEGVGVPARGRVSARLDSKYSAILLIYFPN